MYETTVNVSNVVHEHQNSCFHEIIYVASMYIVLLWFTIYSLCNTSIDMNSNFIAANLLIQ